jgi:uncharacterized protein
VTLDELLTEVDGRPRLVGSRCVDCGVVTFPVQRSCPRCTGQRVEQQPLAPRGTLWSWTVQAFRPKTPFLGANQPFTPYGVGYIDLAGEILVEGRLVTADLDGLHIGMPMELVLDPLPQDDRGRTVVTFAFAPIEEAA